MAVLIAGIIQILVIIITLDVVIQLAMAMGTRISTRHPLVRTLRSITEPLYTPVRRLLPPPRHTGGLDFAPMVVVILLQVIRNFIR